MRKFKKCLALLLVIILCTGVIPTGSNKMIASAAGDSAISYREQLTDVQKEIYDELVEGFVGNDGFHNGKLDVLTFKPKKSKEYNSQAALENAFNNDAAYAVFAFIEDYPQLFWAKGYSMNYSIQTGSKYKVVGVNITVSQSFNVNSSMISQFKNNVMSAADQIRNSLPANATEFEKHMAIHDWICNEAYYSENGRVNPTAYPKTHTAYPLFGNGEDGGVVCEGYAKAYKILCDYMGLDAILVTGYARSNGSYEAHMWNKVRMSDGKWYVVDATWDDQDREIYYNYFLCGENSKGFNEFLFKQDHLEDNEVAQDIIFDSPKLSQYGYSGYLGQLTYTYDKGVLTIGGKGTFPEYLQDDRTPWYPYIDEIKTLIIGDKITRYSKSISTNYCN